MTGQIPIREQALQLTRLRSFPGIRVLCWDSDVLYASRGYQLVRLNARDLQTETPIQWEPVATFIPVWWRSVTSRNRLTSRLVRDGFHALAVFEDQTIVAAVPGAIVTRGSASRDFRITHRIFRGTRPLHLTAVPNRKVYWGEYFDNRDRAAVHIYGSADCGQTWQVAYTFAAGIIRHVHNIIYDRYADCLWILTGDEGHECKILRADPDLRSIETVLSGNQQARAVVAIPTKDALYLSTDTPFEQNHILRLDRKTGNVVPVTDLPSSSIYGCQTPNALFFSTMVEPSEVNKTRDVLLLGSSDGAGWQSLATWRKDALHIRYFQYGNVILPDGENATNYLAATTIAVNGDDLVTTIWEVSSTVANESLTEISEP